jgi:hypothetical protein
MDKNRSQHFNFTFESLPLLFHGQPDDFFTYLEKDGNKFFEFWWDHMGVRLGDDIATDFPGMEFEIREVPEKKSSIALLTLPKPKNFYEVYLMAMVRVPRKRFFIRLPNTRVFALEYVSEEQSSTGTFFGEITPRARFVRLSRGPEVNLDAFYEKVVTEMWKK